jgi:MoaA/NifB/PqqE/SkfB family radical SAM enzyme
VTPNKNIFCNAPWYELQIYWDGSLGFCCQESHKLYSDSDSNKYNLKSMTIQQWFDSEPMRQARLSMLGEQKNSFCSRCYYEEKVNNSSRRHRANQKSVIFTKNNFDESFQQSPHFKTFKQSTVNGRHDHMPVDLHIDLGNYCNLTCKMCNAQASSSIAHQHVKWGITESAKYVGTDWTRNDEVWQRTLEEIVAIPKLKNIHFMGGETLITKRFEDFVDYFINSNRYDVGFSFVTNGTTFNQSLLNKLKKFQRVGIEISIETATEHNSYQRQGTDNAVVFENIHKYLEHCNGTNITLTIRPAITSLSIGYYHTLLEFCLHKKLLVKSLICTEPAYYNPTILPDKIKSMYLQKYREFKEKYLNHCDNTSEDFNESDPNEFVRIIEQQVDQCINLLQTPAPVNQHKLLSDMVTWCKKWDSVNGYNARDLYPEFSNMLDQYGY